MFKIIIFIVIGYVLYRAVTKKRIVVQPNTSPEAYRGADEMVQDPLCKTYFPREQGVALEHQDEVVLFCSQNCLEKYKVALDAKSNDSTDGRS